MAENQEVAQEAVGAARTLTGTVLSNKMDKTITVVVVRLIKHLTR